VSAAEATKERLLTIGGVCARLRAEFPDISISKIRYLEHQGLVTPKRTNGGYRKFTEEDVDMLERILRLQRDEFLPLKEIRKELTSPSGKERRRRRSGGLQEAEPELDLGDLCERAGIEPELARELEEFGLVTPRVEGGERFYSVTDAEIAQTCAHLSRYGIAPRHLRTFRTAAGREAGLVEAVVAPALRARNPDRRRTALEDLESLGALAQDLSQLLLWRDLRRLATG
jgi:DNA-binding transcriptional MerR regulator